MRPELSRRQMFAAAGAVGMATVVALPLSAAGRSERLKITRVEFFKVVVPMQDDIINSPEFTPDDLTEFPKIPKFILKVHTDSGIVGIGETERGADDGQLRQNAAWLQGKNILDLNLTRLELPSMTGYSAFEMALYDAVGKALGWPVYKLL